MTSYSLLYIITGLPIGGAEKLLLDVVRRLNKHRFNVTVVCFRDGVLAPAFQPYAQVYCLDIQQKFHPFIFLQLWRILRDIRPQLVHTHLFEADLLGGIAAYANSVPVVLSTRHAPNDFRRKTLISLLNRLTQNLFGHVIVNSQYMADFVQRHEGVPARKTFVLYNGIDVSKFPFRGLRDDDTFVNERPTIGCIATLKPEKGHEYLIRALPLVLERYPGAHLILVGDGELRGSLEKLVKELALGSAVRFVGTQSDVVRWLNSFDIFVLPSLFEGFGISVIESMSVGVPVIASRVGGLMEVIEDRVTGLLVPPCDPHALAESILDLLDNPDLRSKLVWAARRQVENRFTIEKYVGRLESFYCDLLALD